MASGPTLSLKTSLANPPSSKSDHFHGQALSSFGANRLPADLANFLSSFLGMSPTNSLSGFIAIFMAKPIPGFWA